MSFELFFFRFAAGNAGRFDPAAVQAALARHGLERGNRFVTTRDGLDFELDASVGDPATDHDELLLSMRGMTAGLLELAYDLAHAGKLALVTTDEDARVLVTQPELASGLPAEHAGKALVCPSAEALATILFPMFERWRAWAL